MKPVPTSTPVRKVTTRAELTPYLGWQAFDEPMRSFKRHSPNEPGMHTEVRLCQATVDYVYHKFTPTKVNYVSGSRPALEELIHQVILRRSPRPDDVELTMRCWDWVSENVRLRPHWQRGFRYFGTEEDIAALLSRKDCYCTSKLLVTLLQVAAIPARLVHMLHADISSMHTAVEVWLDRGWRYLDASCHDCAMNQAGKLASFWEIVTDPYCRTRGLREDKRTITAIADPGRFECISVQNHPVADSTAHYQREHGSHWFDDKPANQRTARHGF